MARGRFLSESIAKDKRLNDLSIEAELVYLMTIPHLDRDGLIDGDPDVLWGTVCPKRRQLIDAIPDLIDEWVTSGLVVRYDCDEGPVLFFLGFAKNQQGMRYDREGASKFPPPPGYVRDTSGLIPQDYESLYTPTPEELRTNSGNCRAEVEVQDQDQVEVKAEAEGRPAAAIDPDTAMVWDKWQRNMSGTLTEIIASKLHDLIDEYGAQDVVRGITIQAERGKHGAGVRYLEGILRNGIDTPKPTNGYPTKAEQNDAVFARMRERLEQHGCVNGSGDHVQQLPQRAGQRKVARQLPAPPV